MTQPPSPTQHRPASDRPFFAALGVLGGTYILLLLATLGADTFYTSPGHLWRALQSPEIRHAVRLSLLTCTLSTLLSNPLLRKKDTASPPLMATSFRVLATVQK